jgi:carbamoyltransferase
MSRPTSEDPVYVLGISGKVNHSSSMGDGHHPSAALLKDGAIVAMAGEERFNRIKYSVGYFPYQATKLCLKQAGIQPQRLDAIGWACNPYLATERWIKVNHTLIKRLVFNFASYLHSSRNGMEKGLRLLSPLLKPWEQEENQKAPFSDFFRLDLGRVPFFCIDHHLAHAASAYYASGFSEATVITWDGSGDGLTGSIYHGKRGRLDVLEEFSDFSIGEFYWAIHRFLKLSDEGSLMGLAGYGTPRGLFADIADPKRLYMDLSQVSRPQRGDSTTGYCAKLIDRLGPTRLEDEPLDDRHKTIAADLQQLVEDFGFAIVRRALTKTGCPNAAFAGGVALNATMNGKLLKSGLIDRMFVQPDAGDGGGALGAAYVAYQKLGYELLPKELEHVYWGSDYTDEEIENILQIIQVPYQQLSRYKLIEAVCDLLVSGKIVGWFQGRAEWGPRALGSRSILADPRIRDMLHKVNAAIKYRDEWRPFAPSMIEEVADQYLDRPTYAPFMITTFPVKPEKRCDIAAVVHVDGTTRPQTVRRSVNALYYDLIKHFGERTGVPVVLNTSFNLKGEPIVNSPRDALRTFFSSGLDALAMGSFLLKKQDCAKRETESTTSAG